MVIVCLSFDQYCLFPFAPFMVHKYTRTKTEQRLEQHTDMLSAVSRSRLSVCRLLKVVLPKMCTSLCHDLLKSIYNMFVKGTSLFKTV